MKITYFIICALLIYGSQTLYSSQLSTNDLEKIETVVLANMKNGQIPGLAIVLIKEGQLVLEKGYGYADLEKKQPTSTSTLFELGSTTKAFTGLAILKLAREGKIDLNAPLDTYLPWFYATYEGEKSCIRVADCLYHTSGIPFHTLANFSPSSDDQALENTIAQLSGIQLSHKPSQQFQYTTINYDILGLLIQTVSHQSYEKYMHHNILLPLELTSSFLDRDFAYNHPDMSLGYKVSYLKINHFLAPSYRGNAPAGYLISNAHDVGKWLLYQINENTPFKDIFQQSHEPNRIIPTFTKDSYYAAGWFLFHTEQGQIFSHPGNNPNFSSYFSFCPKHRMGVAVLANMNSGYTSGIGQSIMSIMLKQEPSKIQDDIFQKIDLIATSLLFFTIPGIAYILVRLMKITAAIYKGKRKMIFPYRLISLGGAIFLIACFTYCFYFLPNILFWGFNWNTVKIWGPSSFSLSIFMLYTAMLFGIVYAQLIFLFPNPSLQRKVQK